MSERSTIVGASLADVRHPSAGADVGKRRPYIGVLGLIASLALAQAAFAADDNQVIFPGGAAKSQSATTPAGGPLNTVTLVVGLALASVGGWLVWRNRRGTPLSKDLRALAIAETRSLGNRQFLVVASYEGKKFLLGVCPGSINLLTALPEASGEKDSRA